MSEKIVLRMAKNDDLQSIDKIYRAGLATEIQGSPEMDKKFIRMPSGTTWIAEIDGEPVGFVNYRAPDLRFIYVHPDFHRQGIGKLLMTKAMDELGEEARLMVYTYNEKAKKLYESYGFQAVTDGIANDLQIYKKR